jgi:hypothetical protein
MAPVGTKSSRAGASLVLLSSCRMFSMRFGGSNWVWFRAVAFLGGNATVEIQKKSIKTGR